MKALSFASILGIVGFTLMISACSDEKNAFNTNECPKDALCLYKNVSFSQNIMPNAYKASIRITESDTLRKGGEIESATKKDIANTLNDIITLSKRKGFCEGGNHDLRPNIQYKDGAARDTVGYTLSFSLECDVPSKQKKDYDAFIADIDKKSIKINILASLLLMLISLLLLKLGKKLKIKPLVARLSLLKKVRKNIPRFLIRNAPL